MLSAVPQWTPLFGSPVACATIFELGSHVDGRWIDIYCVSAGLPIRLHLLIASWADVGSNAIAPRLGVTG
jgi:hypothetical protein